MDIETIVSGTSQLNSNSDEGLRLLIRSQPTPIGRYVFANRHLLDRQQALQAALRDLKRQQLQRQEVLIEIARLQQGPRGILGWLESQQAIDLRGLAVQRKRIELEELHEELAVARALIRDCERECRLCEEEIQRVEEEAGIRFRDLPESGFQLLMKDETHRRYVQKIAAMHLSRALGIPLDVATMLYELPAGSRAGVFRAYQAELADIDLFLGDMERGHSAFGNLPVGAERFDYLATGTDS